MHSRRIRHLHHWRLGKPARERYASVSFIRFRGRLLQSRSRHGKTNLPVTLTRATTSAIVGEIAITLKIPVDGRRDGQACDNAVFNNLCGPSVNYAVSRPVSRCVSTHQYDQASSYPCFSAGWHQQPLRSVISRLQRRTYNVCVTQKGETPLRGRCARQLSSQCGELYLRS